MKLNIGCGFRILAGYVNMDLRSLAQIHEHHLARFGTVLCVPDGAVFVRHDVRYGLPQAAGTVREIILRETLEHFSYREAVALLVECHRVLRVGGFVSGLVPDLRVWLELFLSEQPWPASLQPATGPFATVRENTFARLLFGDDDIDGYAHRSQYTHEMLRQVCALAGLSAETWNEAEYERVGLYFKATKEEVPASCLC